MIDPYDIGEIYENIPTLNNGVLEYTSFKSREEFAETLERDYFKEPGEYEFDDNIKDFNPEKTKFEKKGWYCEHLENTMEYEDYWDDQKLKSRKGLFIFSGSKKWFLPREYYFWLNFLPIINKKTKKRMFPDIWDTQLHMALYELIAELKYMHAVVLKKRQFGSSFYHVAKLINCLWFEDAPVLKMGASLGAYLTGVNGSWRFAQMYRSHLNKTTAWTREMNPGGVGEWTQKIEVNEGGRKYEVGSMGTLNTTSFEQSDTAGVGGLTTYFFYEEAGVAKSMDATYEFLQPAMELGDETTGQFIAAGTVGDLSQCKPLKTFMYKAKPNGFYAVKNKWANKKGTVVETGLFIPEQYSMTPYIDEYGNSLVDEAIAAIDRNYERWEQDLRPEMCQIRKSQHPKYMEDAFAAREESKFPLALVESHALEVDDGKYPYELVKLEETVTGSISIIPTRKPPIHEFPVDKKMLDKTGSIVIWERPDENPEWGTYYGSVDPVAQGKTTASDSLCSIFIYKNPVEVTRRTNGILSTFVEGDKIVASWCGRYDDINDTHNLLEYLIRLYNAWTLVEANVSLFIVHMISRRLQKFLVPKSEMVFLKEHGSNLGTFQEYGWKNTGTLFTGNLLTYLIEFLKEKINQDFDEEGNVVSTTYGIQRIPDRMALEEMKQYEPGLNVDRLIALAALISFVKLQNANRGYKKKFETEDKDYLENSDKIYNLKSQPFRNIGRSGSPGYQKQRMPFKRRR